MVFRKRILVVAAVSAAWSVVGTEAVERLFALAGPIAPATALAVLLASVGGYGLYRSWGLKTTVVLCLVSLLSFVVGFVAYFVWSASSAFPDTAFVRLRLR